MGTCIAKQSSHSNAERKSSLVSYVANYTKKSNIIKYEKQQILEVFYNVKHPTPADLIEYQINYRDNFSSKAIEPVNITDPQFQPDQCMIVAQKPVTEVRPQKEFDQRDFGNKLHKNNNQFSHQQKEYQEKPEQEPEWMDDDDDTYQDMKLEDFAFATQQQDFKSKLLQKPKKIDINFNNGFDHIDQMLEKQFGNTSNDLIQQDDLYDDDDIEHNQNIENQSDDDNFLNDSENQLEDSSSQNDGQSDHSNIDDYFDKNKDSKDENIILPIGSKPTTNFGTISKAPQVKKQDSPMKQDDDEITFDKLYQSQKNMKDQKNIEQKLGLGQTSKNQLWENTELLPNNIPKPQQFFQNMLPLQQQTLPIQTQQIPINFQTFDLGFVEKQCQQLYALGSEYNKIQLFIIFTKQVTTFNIADRTWFYKDPQNVIQGPFSSVDMDIWNQDKYFMTTLEISWTQQNEFMTILQFKNNPIEIIKLAQKHNLNFNTTIKQQQKPFMDLNDFAFKKPQDLFIQEIEDKKFRNGIYNQLPQNLNQIGQLNNLYGGGGFNLNQIQNKNKQNLMNMQNIQQMFKQNFSVDNDKIDYQPANPNNVPTLQSFMNIPNIQNIPNLPNSQQIQKIPDMASINKLHQDEFKFFQFNQINQSINHSNNQHQSNNVLNQQNVKNKEKAPTTLDIKMMLGLNQEK